MNLFCFEACGLLGNEFGVVEIVDLHGVAHFVHGASSHFTRLFGAFFENVVDGGNVLL